MHRGGRPGAKGGVEYSCGSSWAVARAWPIRPCACMAAGVRPRGWACACMGGVTIITSVWLCQYVSAGGGFRVWCPCLCPAVLPASVDLSLKHMYPLDQLKLLYWLPVDHNTTMSRQKLLAQRIQSFYSRTMDMCVTVCSVEWSLMCRHRPGWGRH